ncbi:MAG: hypothetical protein ACXV7C_14730, partial [Candidatus Angelobacter sp.]
GLTPDYRQYGNYAVVGSQDHLKSCPVTLWKTHRRLRVANTLFRLTFDAVHANVTHFIAVV